MSNLLPGAVREITPGDDCPCQYDECSDAATHEYLTAADTFGEDWLPLCQAHVEQFRMDVAMDCIATCDWCKAEGVVVAPFCGFEEGVSSAVYDVCETCRGKAIDKANEEGNVSSDSSEDDYDEMPELDTSEIDALFSSLTGTTEPDPQTSANDLDNTFNLNGPTPHTTQVGFSAHWPDGVQMVLALDLAEGALFWRVFFPKEFYFVRVQERVQFVSKRIRALGYRVTDIEEI